ncbi:MULTISPECIES: type II secretion system F family protein [unclassified Pseudonocardia]|uniref:type II secretion system F family protein n=1 Tax=unclassified Pseudonocardia TaxID=2619320 RepID=UPI0009620D55|nr:MULTISPECIES: type II secretion system F family protein [unclassified Pseudonocardia]MBN9103110.1 type II secretion system F family protein [Pseudonocardia sp.]OJY41585.1 MAG: hypothetical protein BGP03_20515 [Pseudonocardia sp. 73-21]
MNPALVLMLLAGGTAGAGLALMLAGSSRGHPSLRDALAALDERTPTLVAAQQDGPWRQRLALDVLRRLPGTVPDADLDVLGISRDRFLLARAAACLTYAAGGPVLAATLAVLDAGLGVVVPGAFTVVGAVAGWTSHTRRTTARADAARVEMRFAVVSYLQQVSLLRRGGAGVATALVLPAKLLDDSWAMRRIRDELEMAERSGQMPWEGLRRFGERIQLDELTDLSSIAATAGQDGGAVVDTLLARAESLRDQLLADEHADANRASGQMSTPGALQVFLIAAWVLFPAGVALLTT